METKLKSICAKMSTLLKTNKGKSLIIKHVFSDPLENKKEKVNYLIIFFNNQYAIIKYAIIKAQKISQCDYIY